MGDEAATAPMESLALPACTVGWVQQERELRFDEDFGGDGAAATADDMRGV